MQASDNLWDWILSFANIGPAGSVLLFIGKEIWFQNDLSNIAFQLIKMHPS